VKKWKLLAYHLRDFRVQLAARVPQVGNPCSMVLLITFVRGKTDHQYRNGQLIWLMGHVEHTTYGGGPYLLMAIEASLGSS